MAAPSAAAAAAATGLGAPDGRPCRGAGGSGALSVRPGAAAAGLGARLAGGAVLCRDAEAEAGEWRLGGLPPAAQLCRELCLEVECIALVVDIPVAEREARLEAALALLPRPHDWLAKLLQLMAVHEPAADEEGDGGEDALQGSGRGRLATAAAMLCRHS